MSGHMDALADAALEERKAMIAALRQARTALLAWQDFPHSIIPHCVGCSVASERAINSTEDAIVVIDALGLK